MNSIKNIVIATVLSALAFGDLGTAQAAETVKPLQGVNFHTTTKDAVAYFTADKGTCKVVLTLTDKANYAPTRFEVGVGPRKSALYQLGDGKALEFACHADAQAMTINMEEFGCQADARAMTPTLLETVATNAAGVRPQRGFVMNTPRPLNVDIPAFVWLIADNRSQGADEPRHGQPRREFKDASLGLENKTTA